MNTRRFMMAALLASLTVLVLFALNGESTAIAQSPQATSCPTSFEWVRQWGNTGSAPGQFQAPVAVAVDLAGNIHVVDRDNRRIQKFDPLGGSLLEYGNEDGRVMINPNGIETGPNGYMYIADTGQHRILYYSAEGQIIGGWKDGDSSTWRMLNPWGVAGWEDSGTKNVYVVDRNACQILRFHSNGQFIDDWGHCDPAPYLPVAPQDVATYINPSPFDILIYVADTGGNRVMQFDYRLTWRRNWDRAGADGEPFNQPSSVATDPNGCVYVADTGNHQVQVFDSQQDKFGAKFGSQGSGPGQFQNPRGVAVGSNGYVYVADTGNNQIVVYRPLVTTPVVGLITPAGGSLISSADQTTYIFAAGTFPSTVVITHTPRLANSVPSPGNLIGISHFFDITAVYSNTSQPAQPTKPYTITVQYSAAEQGSAIENTLALYFWNGSKWVKESTSGLDTASNRVTASPNHFSLWGVLGETRRVYLPVILRGY